MITLDFETQGIVGNPLANPPEPVGVAVWAPGEEPRYLAWGHPTENNCTKSEGLEYAFRVFSDDQPLLFHNGPFDLSVAERHVPGVDGLPEWSRVHDTQYLVFLDDPYAPTLSLKPSAARYLNMPPEEQDELKVWILQHVPEATEKDWGGYIARAPAGLVGRYAVGDVVRTRKLFDYLHPRICDAGMQPAYDRERQLMPVLYRSSQRGIRVDRTLLEKDYAEYQRSLDTADERIRKALGTPSLDFAKRGQLAEALERAGLVTEWALTPTGKKSTSKKTLKINTAEVASLVAYRGVLNTCVGTFFKPWLELSKVDGRLHTSWNQVRTVERDSRGTQTGRLSSHGPNFQNVPTEFDLSVPEGLLPPPFMRRYLLPEVGHVWCKRDFSSQEVRILAHFEDGSLCRAYVADPDLDPHEMARGIILDNTGIDLVRKKVKIVAFSIIYGAGVPGVQRQLGIDSYDEAKLVRTSYLNAMPDVDQLVRDVQNVGRRGDYIRTWGGRRYFAEPSKIVEGRLRSFEYKLLNYLIQGSAADQTKQAIIDWDGGRGSADIFLATVHDEINISVPVDDWERGMSHLRMSMDAPRFDVPFKSEGFYGPNWQEIKACI